MRKIVTLLLLLLSLSLFSQTLVPTDKMALLKGIVTNFKGKPLSKEIILFYNEKTKELVKVNTDAAGKFEVLIPVALLTD